MARTEVPLSVLTPNAEVTDPAGTAVDPTNGHFISGAAVDEVVLRIDNTTATEQDVTIKAGTNPPADATGQGDLVVAVAATSVSFVGPLSSARFIQAGSSAEGALHIDVEAGTTGTITAFHVPRTA